MNKRIVVLDDNREHLAAVRAFLELSGFEVSACETAGEAMERIIAFHPDLLLTDLILDSEDATGLELIEWVRSRDETLPVIAMSAIFSLDDGEMHRNIQRFGVMPLSKPFRAEDLQRLIAECLEPSPHLPAA